MFCPAKVRMFHESSSSFTDNRLCIPTTILTVLHQIYPDFHSPLLGTSDQGLGGVWNPDDSVEISRVSWEQRVSTGPAVEPSSSSVTPSAHFSADRDWTLQARIHFSSPLTGLSARKPSLPWLQTTLSWVATHRMRTPMGKTVHSTQPMLSRNIGCAIQHPRTAVSMRWEGKRHLFFHKNDPCGKTHPAQLQLCDCRENGRKRDHCCLQRKLFSPRWL